MPSILLTNARLPGQVLQAPHFLAKKGVDIYSVMSHALNGREAQANECYHHLKQRQEHDTKRFRMKDMQVLSAYVV